MSARRAGSLTGGLRLSLVGGLAALLLSALASAQSRDPQEVLRVDVKLVTVNARVATADGIPARNLQREDFLLFEDGQDKTILVFEPLSAPLHAALVIDTSASTERSLDLLKHAAEAFLEGFGPAEQVALYQVGPQVERLVGFTADHKSLKRSLKNLASAPQEGTLLNDALVHVQNDFPASARRRALVVFTDGVDEGSRLSYDALNRSLLAGDLSLYSVAPRLGPALVLGANSRAEGTWVLIFDLTATSGKVVVDFQETARQLLEELSPNAQVWMYDYRRLLRLLEPVQQIGLGMPPATALDPKEAQALLRQVGTPQPMRFSPSREPKRRAEHIIVFTDSKRTGLVALADQFELAEAVVLVPTEIPSGRRKQLLQALVHHRQELQRTVWLRLRVAQDRLQQMAEDTGGDFFAPAAIEELPEVFKRIGEQIRTSYALGYYTHATPGRHQVRVQVLRPGLTVRARRVVLIE